MTTSNDDVFEAILAHHSELVNGVRGRIEVLENAGDDSPFEVANVDLLTYLVDDVLTHAQAEERTLYVEASRHPDLAQIVEVMVAEHHELALSIENLARATTSSDARERARAVGRLFSDHVARENHVLLPPLVADVDVDLAGVLTAMQRQLSGEADAVAVLRSSGTDHEAVVVRLLLDAALALARAGQGDRACSLTGAAWAALHAPRPDLADSVNLAMHRLVRMVGSEPLSAAPKIHGAADEFELDVRPLAPAQRHEMIFRSYDELADGTGFLLVNDHDPRPLEYQFEAQHAGAFTWDYLERGPRVWRVRIGRPPRFRDTTLRG